MSKFITLIEAIQKHVPGVTYKEAEKAFFDNDGDFKNATKELKYMKINEARETFIKKAVEKQNNNNNIKEYDEFRKIKLIIDPCAMIEQYKVEIDKYWKKEEKKNDITTKNIELVLEQVGGATYEEAKVALMKTDGDVINAIMFLSEKSKAESQKFKNITSVMDIISGTTYEEVEVALLATNNSVFSACFDLATQKSEEKKMAILEKKEDEVTNDADTLNDNFILTISI
jgi:NACalpha-BTF3-like transcription factor